MPLDAKVVASTTPFHLSYIVSIASPICEATTLKSWTSVQRHPPFRDLPRRAHLAPSASIFLRN
eukprot:3318601-Pyramimonas_sp.AAC.2